MINPVTTLSDKVKQRPAETSGGGAAAIAVLLSRLFHIVDADTMAALVVVVGLTPTFVTWLVETWRTYRASKP